MKLTSLTIAEAIQGMEQGAFTSLQIIEECLQVIDSRDGEIGAFLEVWAGEARTRAEEIDQKRKSGEPVGALAGIPFAIKDILLVQGKEVTAASRILRGCKAPYTATAVQKLLDADAVLIGRTNMDEFACGGSTEHSAYKITKNPHDTTRVPGGSSGGSAAAVACGMCLGALGSDTGGSVRLPASLCGITGLKPTYGRVSRYGLIAMASSLDQIGPMGKTVDDVARILSVIEGHDSHDATSAHEVPTELADIFKGKPKKEFVKGLRIGVPKEYFVEGMDEGVATVVKAAIERLEQQGAKIEDVGVPHAPYALATYYVLMPSEVSSNMARYDGIRYGYSEGHTLAERYSMTRTHGFGDEVKRRILLGTFALSSGYYDAYYKKSVEVQHAIRDDFYKVFRNCDVVVGPTAPVTAFKIGEKIDDPLTMYLADVYTVSANLAGIPALSVPCGLHNGLPVGIQIMAPHFDEHMLFRLGAAIETLT